MKTISIVFLSLSLLTGCMSSKIPYHTQYGYADNNPSAYNNDKNYCIQLGLQRFPYVNPPQYQQIPQNLPSGGVGGAMAAGKIIADIENYNRMLSKQYNDYNNARDSMIDQCLNQRGWFITEKK